MYTQAQHALLIVQKLKQIHRAESFVSHSVLIMSKTIKAVKTAAHTRETDKSLLVVHNLSFFGSAAQTSDVFKALRVKPAVFSVLLSGVCVCVALCGCAKCEWCVRWCSREAAVVLQCNYSLSPVAGRSSPVDSEPAGCWLRQQIDHSWHWPTQLHSTLGEQQKERKVREKEASNMKEEKEIMSRNEWKQKKENEEGAC